MSPTPAALPVAVIGAGPIGLAAAAELVARDQEVLVLEQGSSVAAGVAAWGHVRLFSPWSELISPAARDLLRGSGWSEPNPKRYPRSADWIADYLAPLAAALGERIRCDSRVVGVARLDRDLLVDSGREEQPFALHVQGRDGRLERVRARAVIDASGTTGTPNPLGSEGYPVSGEAAAADRISYAVPAPGALTGQSVAVVGSGASALTSLIELAGSAGPTGRDDSSSARVVWVLRRDLRQDTYGGGSNDELPHRGALGQRVRALVESGAVEVVTGFRSSAVEASGTGQLTLVASDGRRVEDLDHVVCVTGYRPDFSFLSEVRLALDPRLQAPVQLADEIDPNWHSCGSIAPHGHAELAQPETGLYVAGMKSYGRAPSFLAMTGFEQVRSIAAALAGDLAAADRVDLALPQTGVCGGSGLFDADTDTDAGGGCCSPAAVSVTAPMTTPLIPLNSPIGGPR